MVGYVIRFDLSEAANAKAFVFTDVTLVAVVLLAIFVYRFVTDDDKVRGVLVQVIFRCNFLIFAMAVAEVACGDTGLIMAAALAVLVVPLLNVLAVIVLEIYGKSGDKKQSPGYAPPYSSKSADHRDCPRIFCKRIGADCSGILLKRHGKYRGLHKSASIYRSRNAIFLRTAQKQRETGCNRHFRKACGGAAVFPACRYPAGISQ